jgi:nicotinamide-nucleotide amidase
MRVHRRCFLGGAVTYSYDLKENILGVKNETLYQFGAVSRETVTEMVEGALMQFKSDYAVAITGIAGPDGGGTEEARRHRMDCGGKCK